MPALLPSDVKGVFLPSIKTTSTEHDSELADAIDDADGLVAAYLGYRQTTSGIFTVMSASYDLYLKGPGGRRLYVPAGPVTAIAQIDEISTTRDAGDYSIRGRNLIFLSGTEDAWLETEEPDIRVQMTAGYSSISGGLRRAIGLTVAHIWQLPRYQGRSSVGQGPKRESLRESAEFAVPPAAQRCAESFRVSLL